MSFDISPEMANLLAQSWVAAPATDVIVGIRPEQIYLTEANGIGAFKGNLEVSELMGSTVHLHVHTDDGNFVLIVPATETCKTRPQKLVMKCGLNFEDNAVHLFDKNTQDNLVKY